MKKKSKAPKIIGGLVLLGLLAWGGSALASTTTDAPSVPVKPFMPGPGGKGKVYVKGGGKGTLPTKLPEGFDFGGNGLYVSVDCDYVIEGNLFWPTGSLSAVEAPTLEAVLAVSRDNTVVGYLDYLIDTLGYRQPEQVAWKILEEASPMCASVDPAQWGEGLQAWYETFVARVSDYMEEATLLAGDDFDPDDDFDEFDDGPDLEVWEDEG